MRSVNHVEIVRVECITQVVEASFFLAKFEFTTSVLFEEIVVHKNDFAR